MASRAAPAWIRQVPNLLSGLRLGLAVAFVFAPLPWRAAIVVLAALSDFADGIIARWYGLQSWIGGLLDASADKLFALTVIVTLTYEGTLEWWQALLLLARDLAVAFVALYAVATGRWHAFQRMPARPLGKFTTMSLFFLFLVLILRPGLISLFATLLAITAALSILAAIDYLSQFVKGLREDRQEIRRTKFE